MPQPKSYSIIIVPSDHSGTRQFRISRMLLLAILAVVVVLLVTMTIFAATYGTVLAEARRAQVLEQENEQLAMQAARVTELSRELEAISALRAQVFNMLGTEDDDVEPSLPSRPAGNESWETVITDAERWTQVFAEQSRKPFAPRIWPSDGRVRREFHAQPDESGPAHPGLALEVRPSEPVKASAAGRVLQVVTDEDLGDGRQYVEIDHGYGFRTQYHGMTRVDVIPGQVVAQGQPIGRLEAPDSGGGNQGSRIEDRTLYFEVRVDGASVDPRIYLTPR